MFEKFKNNKGLKIRLAVLVLLLVLICPGLYNKLKTVNYLIDSELVDSRVRICLITDLHSCKYGEEESELIDAVDSASPDIILLGGDIFDDEMPNGNTESFIRGISGRYPVYYVTGNHEYWSTDEKFAEDLEILEQYGITRLQGQIELLELNGSTIALSGVDDTDSYYIEQPSQFENQLEQASSNLPEDVFSVLLSHRPELVEYYEDSGFDLVLSGHAHGGQWRIPGILNGLFAPDQGLFPKYAGGLYNLGDTILIVSRGLARESTRIPRLYNRPELVIIDVV